MTLVKGPVGPVVVSSVAPKIATVGTPSAEAMCIARRKILQEPSPAQKLEVVKTLMAWNLARLGNGNRAGQQHTPAVAPVANALRDACDPRHQCRIEGVLQENGALKAVGAQAGG